jgi:branched-chain amino acid transport system ATP-binding protein
MLQGSPTTARTGAAPAVDAAAPILSLKNIEVIYDHVILVLKGVRRSRPSPIWCWQSAAR